MALAATAPRREVRTLNRALPIAIGALVAASSASAQIDRGDYYKHLPPTSRLVAQTGASARLHLYGDEAGPDYVDVAPRDGVDDRRGQRLLRLATRFSPILRRNNFSRPVDFRVAMGGQPVLHVDTWRGGRLLHSDSLALDDASEPERTDVLLVALLKQLGPDAPSSRIVPPEHGEERVLFFDFPGHDERSWRAAYRHITDSRIYAHFFLHEDPSAMGAE
ncbi:MAG TPA: hypothetical protein VMM12_01450, partial [Longimicrobiales bacterium]|nr:hypothetical protein [Longimicrobiales bacterium]